MAPSVAETPVQVRTNPTKLDNINTPQQSTRRFTPGKSSAKTFEDGYEFEDLKPSFPDVKWSALTEVPYEDKGLLGDPDYTNLFADAIDVFDFHPKIGTEIHGINLKTFTDAQKNDLARLIAYRGVVVIRDQHEFTLEDQLELGRYYGVLHKHATTAVPKREGLEEVHVVYQETDTTDSRALFPPQKLWHSDVNIISTC
jgi:sulfonate dioxygenase